MIQFIYAGKNYWGLDDNNKTGGNQHDTIHICR